MKSQLFRYLLPLMLSVACASALPAQVLGEPAASVYPAIRTWREQQQVLAGIAAPAGLPIFKSSLSADGPGSGALQHVERAIRLANVNDPESLCRPVSSEDLSRLQIELLRWHGRDVSVHQLQAITDTAHALLRESPSQSLALKLARTSVNRPGFHGQVAEFTEARERRMQLTRNKQSRMIDLTESKVRPHNLQMKVYLDDMRGVREVIKDLKLGHWRATGVVPQSAPAQGVLLGKLRFDGKYHRTTDGGSVRLEPLRSFPTPAESRQYTSEGLDGLRTMARGESKVASHSLHAGVGLWILQDSVPAAFEDIRLLFGGESQSSEIALRLGQNGSLVIQGVALVMPGAISLTGRVSQILAQSSRLASVSQWAGPIGWVALASYEGFTIWHWNAGYATNRQFYAQQAHFWGGLAGGFAGAGAGFMVGAPTGGFIGAFFGPEAIPIGAAIGGTIGAMGGAFGGAWAGSSVAASGANASFEFHDQKQDAEYIQFLKAHYGVK